MESHTNSTEPIVQSQTSSPESIETSKNLAKSCLDNLIRELKPVFCFKKTADIDEHREYASKCSDDKEINWAECRKKCRDDEHDINGMCTKICQPGYIISNKFRCWKDTHIWYLPRRYFREAVPAECADGYIRDNNGKCKKDCAWRKDKDGKAVKDTGLTNCGDHSCVDPTKTTCTQEFNYTPSKLNDSVSFAQKILASIKSSDISEAEKNKAIQALKESGKHGIQTTYEQLIKRLNGSNGQALRNLVIQRTIEEYEAKKLKDALLENSVKTVCNAVFDNTIKYNVPSALIYADWDTRIVNNASTSIDNYKNDKIKNACQFGVNTNACISQLIATTAYSDPSSYIALTTSYSNAQCEMDYPKPPKHPQENKGVGNTSNLLEKMWKMERGCAYIYKDSNFKGTSEKICRNGNTGDEGVVKVSSGMNDQTSSILVGPGNDVVVFFKHATKGNMGRFIEFGSSSYDTSIHDTIDNANIHDEITSVNFGLAQCAVWQIDNNDNVFYSGWGWDKTKVICHSNSNDGYSFTGHGTDFDTDNFRSTIYNDKLQLTVYEKPNYQGKSKVLDNYTVYDDDTKTPKAALGFDEMKSYKLEAK